MDDKRMLILDAELVKRIDDQRGDLGRAEFLNHLIDNALTEKAKEDKCVSKEEFHQFQEGIRELLRNFLEFFISYGLELGKQPSDDDFEELSRKLQSLGASHKSKAH